MRVVGSTEAAGAEVLPPWPAAAPGQLPRPTLPWCPLLPAPILRSGRLRPSWSRSPPRLLPGTPSLELSLGLGVLLSAFPEILHWGPPRCSRTLTLCFWGGPSSLCAV